MMQKVYIKVSLELIDDLKGFFRKLQEFVGDFTIEGQSKYSYTLNYPAPMIISFYTDKVNFDEGKERIVDLMAEQKGDDWFFASINK